MKNIHFLLVVFFLITSKPYSQDFPDSIPKEVDLGVNGISFSDTTNVKKILNLSNELFDALLPKYPPFEFYYVNKDSSELLVLIFHPGSYRYEFAGFKILRLPEKFSGQINLLPNVEMFVTYKGLSLGMNIDEFKNIFGNDFEEEKNNDEIIFKYTLSGEYLDYSNNEFLKFYKMPFYYGNYTFIKNKLAKIEFGFSYP